ncbi:lectin-like domain-containing protein [Kistimonas asteriae]|uniref:right-handed parallel beta-helix repeat-containing protein n=1 Tax=Kistimonas asteriae TaxID=517724 RepID=UPI001BA47FD9|nr:SdrD B-like domain-containing protein [Kistimonas asteriae]
MTDFLQRLFKQTGTAFSTLMVLVACLYSGLAWSETSGDWFIHESFSEGRLPSDWNYRGNPRPQTRNGWLQLTKPRANQSGYTWFKQDFPSSDGLVITFDFSASEGGSGHQDQRPADGFSVFLLQSINDWQFRIGKSGGGLGYTGLKAAYLGVGFDSFGNFSSSIGGEGGIRPQSNSVVVRAGETKKYRYLKGQQLSYPLATNNRSRLLRTARITVLPDAYGYSISVSLDRHDGSGFHSVLTNVQVDAPPHRLKLGFAASTGANWARHEIRNVRVSRPVNLSLQQVGKTEFDRDGKVRYTLQASNEGNTDANDVSLQVISPGFFQPDSNGVHCKDEMNGAQCHSRSGDVSMDLPKGSSIQVTLTGTVKAGAVDGGSLIAAVTPAPGYQNQNSNNEVEIQTALLSGRVFEEQAGPSSGSARRLGIQGAAVVLARLEKGFNPNRPDVNNWTPAILTHTDANGNYVFPVPAEAHDYRIVALSRSLSRDHGRWAEQTWGGPFRRCTVQQQGQLREDQVLDTAGPCYGGRYAGTNDIEHDLDALWQTRRFGCTSDFCPMLPAIPLGSHEIWLGEHTLQLPKNLLASHPDGVKNLDFGFSYDVVTHVNDSGQGSLRQFIENANQNAGTKRMRFVPAVVRNHDWGWQINLMQSLPVLNEDSIVLDGTAFQFDQPAAKALSSQFVRSGIRVGRNQETLEAFELPDLELVSPSRGTNPIVSMNGSRQTVTRLFLASPGGVGDIVGVYVGRGCQDCQISHSFIGADKSGQGLSGRSLLDGIKSISGSYVTVDHNLIAGTRRTGMDFSGSGVIRRNVLIDNTSSSTDDAISLQGDASDTSRELTIDRNYIDGAQGVVLEGWRLISPEKLTITNNTLRRGGQGGREGAGLRLQAIDGTGKKIQVENNLLEENQGPGVVVVSMDRNYVAKGNRITRNLYRGNRENMGIDLVMNAQKPSGDGRTPNTGNYDDRAPNRGIDAPVISSALIDNGQLVVEGYALPGVTVEFYRKDGNGFSYLLQQVEGSGQDLASGTGSYVDPVSKQVIQKQSLFRFDLSGAQISEGGTLTAIAIDSEGNTSEFGENINVVRAGAITALIWKDLNNDGEKAATEPALNPVKAQLSRWDAVLQQWIVVSVQTTDAKGEVNFPSLVPGRYTVEILPDQASLTGLMPGAHTTNPVEITVESGTVNSLRFGYIDGTPALTLTPNHNRTVKPGMFVHLPHQLESNSASNVDLQAQLVNANDGSAVSWPVTLQKTLCGNGNKEGQPATNSMVIGSTGSAATCFEAGVFVPANAPEGLKLSLTLAATIGNGSGNMSSTSQPMRDTATASATVVDTITVTDQEGGKLVLTKWVENITRGDMKGVSNQAEPGDILQYTIHFTNAGTTPISQVEISDDMPAFTTLSETIRCPSVLPKGMRCSPVRGYDKGYVGKVAWQFGGELRPGEEGDVSYRIKIE